MVLCDLHTYIYTGITDVLHNIRMTTERTKLVHQLVFIKGSYVKRYYNLKLLQLNLKEQVQKDNEYCFILNFQTYDQIGLVKIKMRGIFLFPFWKSFHLILQVKTGKHNNKIGFLIL